MFEQIISLKNIEGAYLDLAQKFDEKGKTRGYTGIDGMRFDDVIFNSAELLQQIKEEMGNLVPMDPVVKTDIPKKDGGIRQIYVYTVKDRIKAQAIFRVVEPIFEERSSDYIYSYRSSHPHYMAAKSVARRYNKYYGVDTVFVSDISNYFDNIDRDIMRKRLKLLGFADNVLKLMDLFIDVQIYDNGKIIKLKKGLVSGVPLIVIYANWYLNDIDEYVGKKASMYRRVGDDFILFDKDEDKVKKLRDYIIRTTSELKLSIKKEKTKYGKSDQSFNFLGYVFADKKIAIRESSLRRAEVRWKRLLKYSSISIEKKLGRLNNLLYNDKESIHNQFVQILAIYRQATDTEQIKKLSEKFYRILTAYFYKNYSARNQRLTKKITSQLEIPSLYQYFLDFHNGRKTLASFSLSKKKHYKAKYSPSSAQKRSKRIHQKIHKAA